MPTLLPLSILLGGGNGISTAAQGGDGGSGVVVI